MADWDTVASLATAGGTLVLAAATFSAVRSSNRSARIAEQALLSGLRPLIVQSLYTDPPLKALWNDRHTARVDGGHAVAEVVDDVIYLAIGLRNAGAGMAVLHAWYPRAGDIFNGDLREGHADLGDFRRLGIDLYVPPSGTGYWESAVRGLDDPMHAPLKQAVEQSEWFSIDILYGDAEGGQRTVSRFVVLPGGDGSWYAQAARHWSIDRPGPR